TVKLLIALALLFLGLPGAFAQEPSREATRFDLLVKGGTVVTMDGSRRILENGVVAVRGDSIAFVGTASEFRMKFPKGVSAKQSLDASGKLVLPGFINGHTHAPMTLFRGLHDDVTLDDWLRKYIFPAEAQNVNEEFVRSGTRLAAAEQIRGGV